MMSHCYHHTYAHTHITHRHTTTHTHTYTHTHAYPHTPPPLPPHSLLTQPTHIHTHTQITQIKWELGSPLFGILLRRMAPHDTYTIWKYKSLLRVDGSLMGIQDNGGRWSDDDDDGALLGLEVRVCGFGWAGVGRVEGKCVWCVCMYEYAATSHTSTPRIFAFTHRPQPARAMTHLPTMLPTTTMTTTTTIIMITIAALIIIITTLLPVLPITITTVTAAPIQVVVCFPSGRGDTFPSS